LDTSFSLGKGMVGGGCGGTWGRKQRQNRSQQKASRLYEGPVHQSLYIITVHGGRQNGYFLFVFSFFVMVMECGIRRETTMTEMVNDDEETSSSVIIYLFILEFIRFSLATPIPRWSGLLYDIYDDMDDIEIVFTQRIFKLRRFHFSLISYSMHIHNSGYEDDFLGGVDVTS
jgi:hypothetical protein